MNNLAKILILFLTVTLISACTEESESPQDTDSTLVAEPEPKTNPALNTEVHQVQFPTNLEITLNLTEAQINSAEIAIKTAPTKGGVTINGARLTYIPAGQTGEDSFTISITDNSGVIEQKFDLYIFNNTLTSSDEPHLLISDPVYGLYNELTNGISVWGYNLDAPNTTTTVDFCDLTEECVKVLNLENRDSSIESLPSLLQGLSDQSDIQHINFSIPETALGEHFIRVSNQFGSSTLPFTVRPKTFEITFDETNFEVQFDQDFSIPLNFTTDEGHIVEVSITEPPSFGQASIVEGSLLYTPSGTLGNDRLTISITDGEKTIEQEFEVIVSDFSPHLALSNPTFGLPHELEDGINIWGYNLGEQQNDTKLEICDLITGCVEVVDINHWKITGEGLPSSLEALSSSKTIQQINFSLPTIPTGEKTIRVSNKFGSSELAFNVRSSTFDASFNKTTFKAQFNKYVTIPLNITLSEGHSVTTSLSVSPTLGEAVIIDNVLTYIPAGTYGEDRLTINITDNKKAIEQELIFNISDYAPHLAFSDLISGPSDGLGDDKGSGVIVTVWGYKLGGAQGESAIELCDLDNNCSKAPHVYYWKNADGQLPSGPANLYESHGMQEIAFSIPNISNGEKQIRINNDYGTSTLPFSVRDGNIYHVTPDGDDDFGDGSFENPWLTVAKADSIIDAGSTLYIHDVISGDENTRAAIYNNRSSAMSSLDAQFSYVAYPNTRPEAIGEQGFDTYNGYRNPTSGFVLSKLSIYAANADEDVNGQPIVDSDRGTSTFGIIGSQNGRAVGNHITDWHPDDLTGACANGQQAAITASGSSSNKVENFKIFGNHIFDYGCNGTSRLQHTTYITIRSGDYNDQYVAPEMGWNYLQDNKASAGLHYFDANQSGDDCGQFTTTVKFHNNVIINQGGPAISFGANCPLSTTFEYYNNIAINVGLKADFDDTKTVGYDNSAVSISINHEQVTAELNFYNNIFYKWSADGEPQGIKASIGFSGAHANATVTWNNNICYTELDLNFLRSGYLGNHMESNISGEGNVWYSPIVSPTKATLPTWGSKPIVTDPLISIQGSKIEISPDSPLRGESNTTLLRDIYGQLRMFQPTIGAIELINE